MKRIFLFLLATCMILVACSDHEDDVTVATEPEADYTVMLYGCGGGNLDASLVYNLSQAESYGYTPRVQFTAKVKYSASVQESDEENYGGTRLYTLTENGLDDEKVAGQGFRLDDPQNIADFISETVKRLPAKHYVLVLWNHGNEFSIWDQPVAGSYPEKVAGREAVVDDNTQAEISIFELEEGLKRSGTKIDLLYWDVCLMNMIENLYQVKDNVSYVLGAAHLTSGLGGNYTQLMHALDNHPDVLEAMKEYIPATVTNWNNAEGAYNGKDLTLCDMNYMDEVVQTIKEYIDAFVELHDDLEPGSQDDLGFDYLTGTSQRNYQGEKYTYYSDGGLLYYFYDNCDGYSYSSSVDLYSAFNRLGNNMLDGHLSGLATKLRISMDKMLPVGSCAGVPNYIDRVSVGLLWMDQRHFTRDYSAYELGFIVPVFSQLYSMLKFDQVTGWSRFLKDNMRKNVGVRETEDGSYEFYEMKENEE